MEYILREYQKEAIRKSIIFLASGRYKNQTFKDQPKPQIYSLLFFELIFS